MCVVHVPVVRLLRGDTLHWWGEIGHWRSTPPHQISTHWCRNEAWGPKNWKFYTISDGLWGVL